LFVKIQLKTQHQVKPKQRPSQLYGIYRKSDQFVLQIFCQFEMLFVKICYNYITIVENKIIKKKKIEKNDISCISLNVLVMRAILHRKGIIFYDMEFLFFLMHLNVHIISDVSS